jgi:hypothetical protein
MAKADWRPNPRNARKKKGIPRLPMIRDGDLR